MQRFTKPLPSPMSNNAGIANEQLLELLLTLKKTTPAAAKGILNAQPAIAYALITLMVSMNAINIEVFQKTLAEFQANAVQGRAPNPAAPPQLAGPSAVPPPHYAPQITPTHSHSSSATPIPAIPPHLQPGGYPNHYRTATPPHSTPTPPMGVPPPQTVPPQAVYGGYPVSNGYNNGLPSQYPPQQPPSYGAYQGYGQPAPMAPPALSDTLAAIPDEQKALIMRVISMTPEQINALPPQERSTYIQIRATLGISTPTG